MVHNYHCHVTTLEPLAEEVVCSTVVQNVLRIWENEHLGL